MVYRGRMGDRDVLFPGRLRLLYEAFVHAIDGAGGAQEQLARTQAAFRLKRQFAWLTPLSGMRCLMTLDMYEPQDHEFVAEIIRYRDDKFTHQIPVSEVGSIHEAERMGWFRLARDWGAKERE